MVDLLLVGDYALFGASFHWIIVILVEKGIYGWGIFLGMGWGVGRGLGKG